ncbi:MAG: flagellar M-ring protein FliF [Solirubrobacteraceae bacterium]|jgi:flagellar M-ring protein FliF|nr:flagellar M-ring protein FliF [Solirubrobacteraceae bacterium]
MPFRTLLANTTPKGRIVMAASALAVLVVLYLMFTLASKPSYSTMLTALDPAETGKITAALDEKGVGYELRNNGTALAVDKASIAQARIALAEQGLPSKGQPGFELFDQQKLGASDFQQKVTYQRALEGQIAGTIGQVQGVSGAQVQLVLPEDQLFADEQSPATAAVLLSGSSTSLEPSAIRGIASLVSSSVKGLKPENVSITDSSGTLLWPNSESGDAAGGGGTSKVAAETKYDNLLESNLTALLAQTVGAGKARVQIKSDLNVDQSTQDKLTYAKRGIPLKQTRETERLQGAGAAAGGRAGTGSNLPAYAQNGAAGGNSNYNRNSTQTDFGVDKTVTRTKVAPGQVNRLSVALVVDKSVPAAQVAQLRTAVAGAAGVDQTRGDVMSVSQVAFAKPVTPPAASPATRFVGIGKYAAVGLGLLVFLFLVMRQLKRRERESLGEPTWLRQIEAPTTLADLEAGRTTRMPALASEMPGPSLNRVNAESIAERDPERVAQQIRTWMQQD